MPYPRRKRSFLASHPKSEHRQQEHFFARLTRVNHPAVLLTVAIPLQALALLSKAAASHFWREGARAGWPDVLCAFPSPVTGGCLFIEFKKPGESPRPNQRTILEALAAQGHTVAVCESAEEAFVLWCEHLGIDLPWP